MRNGYLSDKELQRLIDETECSPLLAAPSYLKTEILYKADRIAAQPVSGKSVGALVLPSSWRFAFYSLKVGLGAAAAVLMLLYIPMGSGECPVPCPPSRAEAEGKLFNGITSLVYEKTNAFCGYLSELTNKGF